MSLRLRFSLVILGLLLAGQALFGAVFFYLQRRSELTATYERVRERVRHAGALCREASLTGDWTEAKRHFASLGRDPVVRYADCVNLRGRVVVHSDPSKVGRRAEQKGRYYTGTWEVSQALRVGEKDFRTVRIGYDAEALDARIRESLYDTLWRIAQVVPLTLLVGLLAAFLVARTLTKPIEDLAEATKELSSGHRDYRLPEDGRQDELGELKRSFNAMADRLEQLDRMKERLVSSLTHDLKNPLASIKGCLEAMLSGDVGALTPKQRRYMESAKDCALRLWSYIDDILEAIMLRSGRIPVETGPASVAEAASAVLKDQAAKARLAGVTLESELPQDLPRVRAERDMVRRVLENLVANALKFVSRGGRVLVRAEKEAGGVRCEVRDSGPGIPREDLEKIFEEYYQVGETSRKAAERGSGMGLSICRRIVEESGGRIWAESEAGKGAAFIFTLPGV